MIELQKVTKCYDEQPVLKDISLLLPSKGLVIITGESGSGKTTLLNIVGMLDENYEGKVLYDGVEIEGEIARSDFRKNNLGFVFQNSLMFNGMNVSENLSFQSSLSNSKIDCEWTEQQAEKLGVSGFLNRKLNELSSGQKQRLAVLRSIIGKHSIVLADEPTGNLDSKSSELVFKCLKEEAENRLILVVTHDQELARRFADYIITLADGVMVESNLTSECIPSISQKKPNEKIRLKPIAFFALKDSLNKRKITFRILMASFFPLLVIGLSISVFNAIQKNNDITQKYVMETNLIELQEKPTVQSPLNIKSTKLWNVVLSDYSFLNNDEEIEAVVPQYHLDDIRAIADFSASLRHYYAIRRNAFFEEKIESMNIRGFFPSSDNEIILASNIAQDIFEEKDLETCIGKKVTLQNINSEVEVTICGINYQADIDGYIVSFLPFGLLEKMAFQSNMNQYSIYMVSEIYFSRYPDYFDTKYGYPYAAAGSRVLTMEECGEIIWGEEAKNDNEIIIDEQMARNYYSFFDEESDPTKMNFQKVVGQRVVIGFDECGTPTEAIIAGICKSAGNNGEGVCFCSEKMDASLREATPRKVNVYIKDYNDIKIISQKLEEKGFSVDVPYNNLQEALGQRFLLNSSFLFIMCIAMIFTSFISIKNVMKINIDESVNDIGLLRTFGFNKMEIQKVYIIETVFVGIIAFLGNSFCYPILINLANKVISERNLLSVPLRVSALAYFCDFLVGVGVCSATAYFTVRKYNKLEIIQLINKIER